MVYTLVAWRPVAPLVSVPTALTETAPRSPLLRIYPSLGVSHFRLLWLGMLPSTIGWQMSVVASGYAALTLSGSATAIGLVTGATGLPVLLLSLVGGVVADRLPRRIVLLCTQSVLGLGAAALAVLSLLGLLEVWHLVALGLVQGAAFSFNMPARQAYIAELVGPGLLRNAVALNNAGMNLSRITGPALAGGLLAIPAIGIGGVFVVMTAMYGIVLASLLRLPRGAPRPPGLVAGGLEQLLEGLRYVRASPVLLALMGLALSTIFFGLPYQSLMPLFSEQVFDVGPAGLGILVSANGAGALIGSLGVAALSSFPRPAALQLGLGVGFGLGLACFALAPFFALAVVLVMIVGFTSAAYTSLNNTMIMGHTDARLYGRVMSVYQLTFAMMPFGALPVAWLADQVGGRFAVAGAGLVVAAIVGGVAVLYTPYRHIR